MMRTATRAVARGGARLGSSDGATGARGVISHKRYEVRSRCMAVAGGYGYNSQMKTASISEAKNRLSAYIDLVRKGETVLITDRKVPIAQLAPLVRAADPKDEAWLQRLERKGLIRRALRKPPKKLPKPVKLAGGASVLEALLKEREEARY